MAEEKKDDVLTGGEDIEETTQPTVDVNQATTEDFQAGLSPEAQEFVKDEGEKASLLRSDIEGSQDVFQITPDGERRKITDPEALSILGRSFGEVREVAPQILEQFKLGKPIDQVTATVFQEIGFQEQIEETLGLDELQKKFDKIGSDIVKFAEGFPALIQSERESLQDEFDLSERSTALKTIDEQIAEFEKRGQLVRENLINQPQSISFIQGQVASQKRVEAIQLNALYSKREAIAGDFDRAERLYKEAFDDFITTKDMELTMLSTVMEIEQSKLSREDQRASEIAQTVIRRRQEALVQQRADKDSITQLNLTYPFAGIMPGDDLETAQQKVVNYTLRTTPDQLTEIKTVGGDLVEVKTDRETGELVSTKLIHTSRKSDSSGSLPSSLGFVNADVEKDVREDIFTLRQEEKTPAEQFDAIRLLYSENEVSDDAIMRLTGLQPVGQEPDSSSQQTSDTSTLDFFLGEEKDTGIEVISGNSRRGDNKITTGSESRFKVDLQNSDTTNLFRNRN